MIKVAINTLPLHTAHRTRGIGYYTKNLLQGLKEDDSIEVLEFTEISRVKEADVVHYPWFDLFFYTLPIIKKFPTVVTVHDIIPILFPKSYPKGLRGSINFFLQKLSLKGCKAIITDSKTSKDDITSYLKIDFSKIRVIPLAADPIFRPLPDASSLRIKRKYHLPDEFLLYVGDANWVKNLPFLIRGFKDIIESGYPKLSLVLVGGVFLKNVENIDHPELQSLKKVNRMIKEYNLWDRVLKPGQIEDEELVAFYNLASIYVQPSLYEGFGLPVLQALSCGTPVVSSNRGSLGELGGEAVVFFDPKNLRQFKSIILEILSSRSIQNKLSKLGIERASKFSWKRVVAETKSVYESIVKK